MKVMLFAISLLLILPVVSAQDKLENLVALKQNSQNEIFHSLGKAVKAGGFYMKDYWVWDNTVIKGDDGKYHLFSSCYPDTIVFHPGWMVSSEIIHAVADKPEGPYHFVNRALTARGAQYWDGRSTYNPQIFKHNGKYYMFYGASTHPFEEAKRNELTLDSKWCIVARSNKRIGLAVSNSLNGPWQRMDKPILDVETNTFYSFLTSNPTLVINKDGSVLMIFKARAYEGTKHGQMSLGVAYANNITGPYAVLNNKQPVFDAKKMGELEDPFLWKDKRGYHVVFKDHKAKYTGELGGGVLAHSVNGLDWKMDKDPKAYSKTIQWSDGFIEKRGQLERPFIFFENNKPRCMFFSTMDGIGGFENGTSSGVVAIPFEK
ncbi:MAG: glycoside hydrolase family protein [Paludibacter sp.]